MWTWNNVANFTEADVSNSTDSFRGQWPGPLAPTDIVLLEKQAAGRLLPCHGSACDQQLGKSFDDPRCFPNGTIHFA